MTIQSLNAPRRGRFEIGNVLGAVGEAFRKHLLVLLSLSLLLYGLPMAAVGAVQRIVLLPLIMQRGDPNAWTETPLGIGVYFGALAVTFIASYVLQAALIHAVVASLRRQPIGFSDCLATGVRYLLPSILVAALFLIGVTFGLVLLIVPGVIFMIAWCVAVPAMVVERKNPIAALGRSWDLTDGFRVKIFLLLMVWVGLNIAFNLVTSLTFLLINLVLSSAGPDVVGWLQAVVFAPLLSSIVVLASGAGIAATYFELRTAKEGFGSEDLAQVFA